MRDLITERTPLVMAVEVNTIKHQTEKVVLNNAIEIGRRLMEAKDLILYGEWGILIANRKINSNQLKNCRLVL